MPEFRGCTGGRGARNSRTMKNETYRVVPLATEIATAARAAARLQKPDHATMTVAEPKTAPCRHCLRWAEPGERVILFPYASIESGSPYAESGPIFIHESECERYAATAEYPSAFRNGRVVRAYDADRKMIDAVAVNGTRIEAVIETLLRNPASAFLQVRSADRGCYTLGIQRA